MALFLTVFGASLFGSLHCAGMCGPFVLLYSTEQAKWKTHIFYHGGRLLTYAVLGALAGTLGSLVDIGGALIGIAQLATILSGALIAIWGALSLSRASTGASHPHSAGRPRLILAKLQSLSFSASRFVMHRPPLVRALGLGLISGLLPCGWLYAFAAVAGGTGSATWGSITMVAFWLGTLPALIAVAIAARSFLGPIGRRAPWFAALSLVLVGLATVGFRALNIAEIERWTRAPAVQQASAVAPNLDATIPDSPHCH